MEAALEAWDRDELYREIWQQPLLKLAPKYGNSSLMLGKVCRKLWIPVPGRGYWAPKESGKPVSRKPLELDPKQSIGIISTA